MLDKSQVQDWDGEPEDAPKPEAKPQPPAAPEAPRGGVAATIFDGREAIPTGEYITLTPQQVKARDRRGQWIAIALFAFVIVIFVLTMTKIGAGVLVRDL